MQAVRMIVKSAGYRGLYTGWRLHFVRDTTGTALYFAEYDVMRFLLGRKRGLDHDGKGKGFDDEQGEVPEWARGILPKSLIPFLCGSLAGVTSWALIYPVDVSQILSPFTPHSLMTHVQAIKVSWKERNLRPQLISVTDQSTATRIVWSVQAHSFYPISPPDPWSGQGQSEAPAHGNRKTVPRVSFVVRARCLPS